MPEVDGRGAPGKGEGRKQDSAGGSAHLQSFCPPNGSPEQRVPMRAAPRWVEMTGRWQGPPRKGWVSADGTQSSSAPCDMRRGEEEVTGALTFSTLGSVLGGRMGVCM